MKRLVDAQWIGSSDAHSCPVVVVHLPSPPLPCPTSHTNEPYSCRVGGKAISQHVLDKCEMNSVVPAHISQTTWSSDVLAKWSFSAGNAFTDPAFRWYLTMCHVTIRPLLLLLLLLNRSSKSTSNDSATLSLFLLLLLAIRNASRTFIILVSGTNVNNVHKQGMPNSPILECKRKTNYLPRARVWVSLKWSSADCEVFPQPQQK